MRSFDQTTQIADHQSEILTLDTPPDKERSQNLQRPLPRQKTTPEN